MFLKKRLIRLFYNYTSILTLFSIKNEACNLVVGSIRNVNKYIIIYKFFFYVDRMKT